MLTVCGFVPRLIVVACLVEVVSVVPFPGSAHHSWTHRSIARARSSRGSSYTPRWVARHRRRSPRQRFSAACLARRRLQRWIGSRVDFHRYNALHSSRVLTSGMDVTSACTRLFPAWLHTVRVDRLDALDLSCAYRQDSTPSCTCTYLYYYDMADGRPDARPVPSPLPRIPRNIVRAATTAAMRLQSVRSTLRIGSVVGKRKAGRGEGNQGGGHK